MFTGLIQDIGKITTITPHAQGASMAISIPNTVAQECKIGDSIAINGVCSTITTLESGASATEITIDYLQESLNKTTLKSAKENDHVNLECCLRPQDRFGGHFVTGHVDTTGEILSFAHTDQWAIIEVEYPSAFKSQLIPKGSIAIDGISLTLVELNDDKPSFTCHLIPHTLSHTILQYKKQGDSVNLETDVIGKYMARHQDLASLD